MNRKQTHLATPLAPIVRMAQTAFATEQVKSKKTAFLKRTMISTALAAAVMALLGGTTARAANHSDAPLIKLDPQANLTDVYTFVGTKANNPAVRVLDVVVQVRPFSEPGDGAIYERFSPDVRYSINIANPATGELLRRYDFQYSPVTSGYKRTNTILSYGQALAPLGAGGQILNVNDANHNYTQTYTLTRVDGNRSQVLGRGLLTPPPNVGNRVTPFYNDQLGRARSGATTRGDLDRYTQQTIFDLPSGETVWSGPREDGFYSDIPGVFNLLDPRLLQGIGGNPTGAAANPQGQTVIGTPSPGTDGFRGYNVLVFAIQIPLSDLPALPFNTVPNPALFGAPVQRGVGVYASTARPKVTLLFDNNDNGKGQGNGSVADDGNDNGGGNGENGDNRFQKTNGPFIQVQRMGNPLFNEGLVAIRDKDNLNHTYPPGDERYATYALNPELARLFNRIYGTPFQETGRTDLKAIFIPEVLRVNTQTEPVRLAGQPGFNRQSTFGGDRTLDGTPGGWPNGRRLGDDVTDITLTLISSGPTYAAIIPVGDGVPANDQLFNQVFPFAATPNAGARNSKDSGENFGG